MQSFSARRCGVVVMVPGLESDGPGLIRVILTIDTFSGSAGLCCSVLGNAFSRSAAVVMVAML